MIRSLKRALQPAITDVSVEFLVPKECEVTQSPQNLPPIFNGEKLVVYATFKSKKPRKVEECAAILKGNMLGATVEHKVPFVLDSSAAEPSLPVIHHLAAKALITDWETEEKEKKSIVDLSIESSVISSHTAFIAIDEESSEPVSGSMKTYDLQARYERSQFRYLRSSGFGGGQMIGASPVLLCAASAPMTKSRGAGPIGMLKKLKMKKKASTIVSAPRPLRHSDVNEARDRFHFASPPPSAPGSFGGGGPPSAKPANTLDNLISASHVQSLELLGDSDEDEDCLHFAPPPPSAPGSFGGGGPPSAKPVDTLDNLISAQQLDGSWELTSSFAQLIGKPLSDLEAACPIGREGVGAAVWATVLAVSLLRSRYSSQQDEWELIAMKAESWLKKQSLPPGTTLEKFFQDAQKQFQ